MKRNVLRKLACYDSPDMNEKPKGLSMIQINISDIVKVTAQQLFAKFSRNFSSVETLLQVVVTGTVFTFEKTTGETSDHKVGEIWQNLKV
jgi:hypothetical protein